ncbi:hypothetical protein GWK91_02180 [Virgibacillus sp. MSP4-1]|uniref:hypothetical protein n=1 Tax=Virgibacillus sp. MSP4-1 TaxID=2700081 RepID=UPI0005C4EFE3|nr:hypothetical protein [Virgibacillus sp. MSP4-1]QHS21824.1 hypothetical protein GWK91_02180 [Virgibacillus sp. MSP4-1]
MRNWWTSRKEVMRKRKKNDDHRLRDYVFDFLSWIPELIVLPIRFIIWIVRGIGKLIGDFF